MKHILPLGIHRYTCKLYFTKEAIHIIMNYLKIISNKITPLYHVPISITVETKGVLFIILL